MTEPDCNCAVASAGFARSIRNSPWVMTNAWALACRARGPDEPPAPLRGFKTTVDRKHGRRQ